jgi:hypothetical protein
MKEYRIRKEHFVSYRAVMDALDNLATSDRAIDDPHYRSGIVDAKIAFMQLLSDDEECIMVSTEEEFEK